MQLCATKNFMRIFLKKEPKSTLSIVHIKQGHFKHLTKHTFLFALSYIKMRYSSVFSYLRKSRLVLYSFASTGLFACAALEHLF